jgi:hypothetical protein
MNDSSRAPIPPSGGAGLNQRLLSSLTALSLASSCLIIVVVLAVLLGWHFDIQLLRAGLPGRTPVNFVTWHFPADKYDTPTTRTTCTPITWAHL